MQLSDFYNGDSAARNGNAYDVEAINRAASAALSGETQPVSLNDLPEPWASFKAEAERLNTEAHEAFMARRRGPIGVTEWEMRGSRSGE